MEKLRETKEPSPAEGESEGLRLPEECPLVKSGSHWNKEACRDCFQGQGLGAGGRKESVELVLPDKGHPRVFAKKGCVVSKAMSTFSSHFLRCSRLS